MSIQELYDKYMEALNLYNNNRFSGSFQYQNDLDNRRIELAIALDDKGYHINENTVIVADVTEEDRIYIRTIEIIKD